MRDWDTGRLLGHFAGDSIAIGLTVAITRYFGDRQGHGGEENSKNEAEASHLDVRCMYAEAFRKYANVSKMGWIATSSLPGLRKEGKWVLQIWTIQSSERK